ncbi:MAG: Ig-like domain-containing domain [Bacteroidota bacterium]
MRNRFLFSVYALMLIASSCAIQVAPTGGEKDVKPPMVKKSSPGNFSTLFNVHDISISFNEYIALKDLNTQLVVSPPLKHTPDIKVKKMTLHIHLEDTLLQHTTYTMNFGNAITDIREGNAVEDFQYVFSTGDVIDSLKVPGIVQNAFDKKNEKGIYIMVYRGTDDSLPLKSLPDYFAKTAEDGSFEVKNVSPGSYRIFALKDNNSNYLFDNSEEAIAFNTETVEAGKSKSTLSLFKETRKQQLLKAGCDEPGHVIVAYTLPLLNEKIEFLSDSSKMRLLPFSLSEKKDTMIFWYRNQSSDSLNFILQHDGTRDTILIRLKVLDPKLKMKYPPVLSTQYTSKSINGLELNKKLQVMFNHPIDSFDLAKIRVTEDSIAVKNPQLFFTDSLKRNLTIDFQRKEKANYAVEIPAGSLKDIFGLRNDSMQLLFRTKSVTDFGTMAILMKIPSHDKNYILQLIDDKESIYRESTFHSDTTINYDFLDPRIYRLKIIEDLNSNNEWDTGNYLQHKQPERVFYYKESLTVRANWDVDVKWDLLNEGK